MADSVKEAQALYLAELKKSRADRDKALIEELKDFLKLAQASGAQPQLRGLLGAFLNPLLNWLIDWSPPSAASVQLGSQMTRDMQDIKQGIENIQHYVNDILASQMGPAASATSKEKKQYRGVAIQHYYGEAGCQSPSLMCMVTGDTFPSEKVIAGHVFRQAWPSIFLARMKLRVNDPRNIIFMHEQVVKKFDSFKLAIIPETFQKYKIVVLDQKLLRDPQLQYISESSSDPTQRRWQDIHETYLHMPSEFAARPARRVCGLHASRAIAYAEANSWVSPGQFSVPEAAWASDEWDASLMAQFLANQPIPEGLSLLASGSRQD